MATTVRQALKLAEADLREMEARLDEQRAVVIGLRMAVDRYQDANGQRPHEQRSGTMPRTDAVLAVLAEHMDEAMGVQELSPLVAAKRNVAETPKNIGAALSYLKGQGKVRSAGHDEWLHAKAPYPGDDVDPDDIPF